MDRPLGRVEVAVGALQRLSSEHRMCVLIVNNAVNKDDHHDEGGASANCRRPSLGRILSKAADTRLKVAMLDGRGGSSSARAVSVDRSIKLAPGAMCKIRVTERGWDELN